MNNTSKSFIVAVLLVMISLASSTVSNFIARRLFILNLFPITSTTITGILLFLFSIDKGLQCYSCQSRENEACGRNPTEANRITCAINKFCIVKRTERTDSTGKYLSTKPIKDTFHSLTFTCSIRR